MGAVGWGATALDDAGNLIPCSCNSGSASISFGGVTVPIPEPGRDIRVGYGFGHVYAVVKGQNTGRCLLVRDDGRNAYLGATYGNQCVGLVIGGSVVMAVYVSSPTTYTQWAVLPDLGAITGQPSVLPIPAQITGTSQGFLNLSPTGVPLWTDLNRTITLPNGVELVLWMQSGPVIIGQGLVAPAQVSAWDGSQMHTVWQGDTSFPPQITVAPNGQMLAGIASTNAVFVVGPFGPYVTQENPSPGPTPIPPTPTPIPPEPSPMPTPVPSVFQFRRVDTQDAFQIGTPATHPDGAPYIAIALSGGKYASLTPAGVWQAPATVAGGWERFIPSPTNASLLAAPRDGGPGNVIAIVDTAGKTA